MQQASRTEPARRPPFPEELGRRRWRSILAVGMFTLTLPATIALVIAAQPQPTPNPLLEAAAAHGVSPTSLARGAWAYRTACITCHGADAEGVKRLGKPLRNSEYVQLMSDAELASVIRDGRTANDPLNTTGIPMPPRGANPMISDRDVEDIVVYLRTLQDPSAPLASMSDWVVAAGTPGTDAQAQPAAAPSIYLAGKDPFVASCSSCHGASGEGIEGVGKALAANEFIAGSSEEDLVKFVKQGRPVWDAANTTGLDMPPKGGNPALGDDELREIVRYVKSLNDGGAQLADAADAGERDATPDGGGVVIPAAGRELFVASCSSCHGPGAEGIEGVGKSLLDSEFCRETDVEGLVKFVKQGRPVWDAANTTGLDMPPKGGNPALSDEDLTHIVEFVKALHAQRTQ